jgi:tetratricopeptide (TPR) repeat protein
LNETIDSIRKRNAAGLGEVAETWLTCALAERDATTAEAALAALGNNALGNDAVRFPASVGEGLLARMTNDQSRARAAFLAARESQAKAVAAQPDYGPALCALGVIDAGLGRKDEALREGRRAIELMPVEKDFINGVHVVEFFAVIAAWVGEKQLACEELDRATRLRGYGVQAYGQLKLSPWWDPLRGDPCFEKLAQSLAPR